MIAGNFKLVPNKKEKIIAGSTSKWLVAFISNLLIANGIIFYAEVNQTDGQLLEHSSAYFFCVSDNGTST